MIWIALVAVVFVAGGTWLVAKSTQTRLIVLGMGLAGVAAYWFIGHPNMGDLPLEPRLDQIEAQIETDPGKVDALSLVAVVERKVRENPKDAVGPLMLARTYEAMAEDAQSRGMQLMQAGDQAGAGREAALMQDSLQKAEQAFGEALRRDGNNPVAMGEFADFRFKSTGEVDSFTARLYEGAYAGQPDKLRLGYMAGIGMWLQGKKAEAEALWAELDKRGSPQGPERQMFAALRQMFGIDPPPSP